MEVTREQGRRAIANKSDAQAEDQPPQLPRLAVADLIEQVLAGLVGHVLEFDQIRQLQLVQGRHVAHSATLDQLAREHIAKAFDIHGVARGVVPQSLHHLRRT